MSKASAPATVALRICASTVPAFAHLSEPALPAGPPARQRAGQADSAAAAAVCRQLGLPADALND